LYLQGLASNVETPIVKSCIENAKMLASRGKLDTREMQLLQGTEAFARGHLRLAASIFEKILLSHPLDILTIRTLHDIYYILGDITNMRDCVSRVFSNWEPRMPCYGNVMGMLAFGLEETGVTERAEEYGMQAINMNPSDAWALHAVVHVLDTTGRVEEGRGLLKDMEENWTKATLLDHHLHWHSNLLALEEGDFGAAVGRLDGPMAEDTRFSLFHLADVSSQLWRMELLRSPVCPPLSEAMLKISHVDSPNRNALFSSGGGGEPPKSRWSVVKDSYKPHLGKHISCYNDVFAAMALVASEDEKELRSHLESMEKYCLEGKNSILEQFRPDGNNDAVLLSMQSIPFSQFSNHLSIGNSVEGTLRGIQDNRITTASVGYSLAKAMVSFWKGQVDVSTKLLLETRPHWGMLGGSHAQRDVFEQTLIHSAIQSQHLDLAHALLSHRTTVTRPTSPQSWYLLGSVLQLLGDHAKGMDAKNRAFVLGLGQVSRN
jgi:tetratricopeptide (TPR) repeat protein